MLSGVRWGMEPREVVAMYVGKGRRGGHLKEDLERATSVREVESIPTEVAPLVSLLEVD